MITHEQIESAGWFRSALASSKYEPNYFLRGSLKDFPSGIWLTGIGDRFRITTMNQEYHEVLFMGKLGCLYDLIVVMDLLELEAEKIVKVTQKFVIDRDVFGNTTGGHFE